MTTSHLTNPAKDAGQVIGYSHSTKSPKALHSHLTKLANYANQVIG
jgi:anthranilate phosphoribosyltransferase